jgi:cytochrome c oxidase subunit 3
MTRPDLPSPSGVGRSRIASFSTRRLGLYVLFGSLTMLFGASLVGLFVTRSENAVWRTPEMARLPSGLWLSTALLVGVSFCGESALRAVRANHPAALVRRLFSVLAFAVLFLLAQLENWSVMRTGELAASVRTLYPYTFYWLTGLHAAHVIGGFVPLGLVIHRARAREYSSSHHEGVALCVQYWHFLGIIWLILFAALAVTSR